MMKKANADRNDRLQFTKQNTIAVRVTEHQLSERGCYKDKDNIVLQTDNDQQEQFALIGIYSISSWCITCFLKAITAVVGAWVVSTANIIKSCHPNIV